MDLIKRLTHSGIIRFGKFTLKSGQKSNVYVDFRQLLSYPKLLKHVAYHMSKRIPSEGVVLAGVPMGGIHIANAISFITNTPCIMVRDKPKEYGMQNMIEGHVDGRECILIEDVITTGSSLRECIKKVEDNHIKIHSIYAILDREAGGVTSLRDEGYTVNTLFRLSDFDSINSIKITYPTRSNVAKTVIDKANAKMSNLILSADVKYPADILRLVQDVGAHIVGVKLHLDMVDFSTYPMNQFMEHLEQLKYKYGLFIIEDRKFADIGSVMRKQLAVLSRVVDIVTIHGITGRDSIVAVDEMGFGLLPVHQLSTKGNLIDDVYSAKLEDVAPHLKNLVGFISQEKTGNILTFTPGVCLNMDGDMMGQQYKTPEELHKSGTDFFIVGRGIYQSEDPVARAKEYAKACWKTLII